MEDELYQAGCRMAEALQELVDAGHETGSDMRVEEDVLKEWHELSEQYLGGGSKDAEADPA